MNDKPDPVAAHASARRRLVRGAFAAPAVMTLVSGRALAATSATMCVKSQVSNPTLPAYPQTAPTLYISVQRYVRIGSSPAEYWIKGDDVKAKAGSKNVTVFLTNGEYMKLTSPNGTKQTTLPTGGLQADGNNAVLLLVDANGNIKGAQSTGISTSGLSAVAGTCWTSFIAQP